MRLLLEFVQFLCNFLVLKDVVVVVEQFEQLLFVLLEFAFDALLVGNDGLLEFVLGWSLIGEEPFLNEVVELVESSREVDEGHVGAHVGQECAEGILGDEDAFETLVKHFFEPCELDLLRLHLVRDVDLPLEQRLQHRVDLLRIFDHDLLAVLDRVAQFALQVLVRGLHTHDGGLLLFILLRA